MSLSFKFSNINLKSGSSFEFSYQIKLFNDKFNIDIGKSKYLNDLFVQFSSRHKELAIVGDSILTFVLMDSSFLAEKSKGDMSNIRQKFTSNQHLAKICDILFGNDIQQVVQIQYGEFSTNIKATFIEAFIGFLYYTFSLEKSLEFINNNVIVN